MSFFLRWGLLFSASFAFAQDVTRDSLAAPENWNLYWQATSIGQHHPAFRSLYRGTNSLDNRPETLASLTTTLFLGLRVNKNTRLYFNPEIAGGQGFSGVTGVANFPNGEMPRVGSATPTPYLARLYVTHDFRLGAETDGFMASANELAGDRPHKRYSITIGRFTVTDFFDKNRYSHDPRTQFMGWATMYSGAWDYPADLRGYTWGWMHELQMRRWSVRYASVAEPRVANGARFDRRLFRNRGDIGEGEFRYSLGPHMGAVRLLGSMQRTNSGDYAASIALAKRVGGVPDITATRKNGTLKYGWGLNVEQEVATGVGVFARVGWNDGKTESFAFTVIDHSESTGVTVSGEHWGRPLDTVGSAYTVSGLSAIHTEYLRRGGLDFLLGDGGLRYGTERIWESYYSSELVPGFTASVDAQQITNPAYNRDRGPLWAVALRLHVELSAKRLARARF